MPSICHAAKLVTEELPPSWTREYEQRLTATNDFDWLGIPKSWPCVRQGFHPFSPERTLVLNPTKVNRHPMVPNLVERIGRHLTQSKVQYDQTNLAHISYCAAILTANYGIPNQAEPWCRNFASGFCGFFVRKNLNHLFMQNSNWQGREESVSITNDLVDWWLFLIPDGLEAYCGGDKKRLHVLITPVYHQRDCLESFDSGFEFSSPMAYAVRYDEDDDFKYENLLLSQMDQSSACLFLNQRVAANFTDTSERWTDLLRWSKEGILKQKDQQSNINLRKENSVNAQT